MEITSKALSTEDMDTLPDKLVYNIEANKNGIIALKESPDYSIERFTQAQINNGDVIFIHKGSPLQMSLCLLGQIDMVTKVLRTFYNTIRSNKVIIYYFITINYYYLSNN